MRRLFSCFVLFLSETGKKKVPESESIVPHRLTKHWPCKYLHVCLRNFELSLKGKGEPVIDLKQWDETIPGFRGWAGWI